MPLSTAEYRLLCAFLNYAGWYSATTSFYIDCRRTAELFDRSINNQVSPLRKKIKAPALIKTHWGVGSAIAAAAMRYGCVIRNLIENAVRYGQRAWVSLTRDADSIEVIAEDDEPEIPPNLAEQVFGRFVRLEDSRNRETGCVGLGLSIARSIVRNHGGDIRLVNSDTGRRAVITLSAIDTRNRLPAAA